MLNMDAEQKKLNLYLLSLGVAILLTFTFYRFWGITGEGFAGLLIIAPGNLFFGLLSISLAADNLINKRTSKSNIPIIIHITLACIWLISVVFLSIINIPLVNLTYNK